MADLVARFRTVAAERLGRVRALARAVGERASDADREELARELHTLKGEARVVGLPAIAQLVHAAEELLRETVPGTVPAELDAHLDRIEEAAVWPGRAAPGNAGTAKQARIDRLLTGEDAFLRVSTETLHALAAAAAELRVGEGELPPLLEELERLEPDVPPAAAARLRQAVARGRQLAFEQHHRLERLLDRVRAARMVRLATLLAPFTRAARDLAAELGKDLDVELEGVDVEIDQGVLDVLREPLVHLVRNAVDHGIEAPDVRERVGKRRRGRLALRARTVGPTVRVEVGDDGRGIDVDALAEALRTRGEAAEIPEDAEALLELLCRHGLSSRRSATEHSGRGVGLDVVKRRTESVGGRLSLTTERGEGTTFALEVPTTTVLSTMACIELDGALFGFAPHELERAVALGEQPIETAGSALVTRIEEELVPIADLASLLDGRPRDPRARRVLVVTQGGRARLALAVDRFVGTRAVLEQRLDAFLERTTAVRSVAVLASGGVAIALDLPDLCARHARADGGVVRARTAEPKPRRRALVVDDSELTRDVLVAALRDLGLEVLEAANGRIAIEVLTHGVPDLVLTDLDMPVLDGFGLLGHLRARHRGVPVIVLSTRGAPEDVQRAIELGADAYLVKTRLELDELRAVVLRQLELGRAEVGA